MSGPHPVSACIWWRVGFWGLSAGPRPIGIPKRLKARGALYIRDNRPFGLFRTFTSGKGYGFFFSFGNRTNGRGNINAVWSRMLQDTFRTLNIYCPGSKCYRNVSRYNLRITPTTDGTVIFTIDSTNNYE